MSGSQATGRDGKSLRIEPFGDDDAFLFGLLDLKTPLRQRLQAGSENGAAPHASRQLEYLCQYVRTLGCQTVVLENRYVDRHFIEDYGAFYARMFSGCSNHCQRLHFFSAPKPELQMDLQKARDAAAGGDDAYRAACRDFSRRHYLGFSVIRPLRGAPIGRTVLKTYPEIPKDKPHRRRYPAVHLNKVHLLGVELTVDGIAFQEQDGGVSACATAAIWSSLHYLKGSESFPVPTPAEITRLASRMVSPNGRTFPSEGLTVEQMCIALQSLRVSPCILKVVSLGNILPIIYSAVSSEMAPILVMKLMTDEAKGEKKKTTTVTREPIHHAVTVTGLKIPKLESVSSLTKGFAGQDFFEPGNLIRGLYLHDDRWGPYMASDILTDKPDSEFLLQIKSEQWVVEKVLIPMYPRINLSFSELHDLGLSAVNIALTGEEQQRAKGKPPGKASDPPRLECRFVRGHKYVEHCLFHGNGLKSSQISGLCENLAMPRYVGLITVTSTVFGQADILIDSTTTAKNVQALAVVPRSPRNFLNVNFCRATASRFDTQAIVC